MLTYQNPNCEQHWPKVDPVQVAFMLDAPQLPVVLGGFARQAPVTEKPD